jgi:preprotein translocase SecE subunit
MVFIKSTCHELKNVNWLKPKNILTNFFMILIFIVLMAIFIGIVDFLICKVLSIIL